MYPCVGVCGEGSLVFVSALWFNVRPGVTTSRDLSAPKIKKTCKLRIKSGAELVTYSLTLINSNICSPFAVFSLNTWRSKLKKKGF